MERNNKNKEISSSAQYLTFVASTGNTDETVEMRYEHENIWLPQKMMAELYGVSVAAINQHLKKIFTGGELVQDAVIKKYLITAEDEKNPMTMEDWEKRLNAFLRFNEREILQDVGRVTAEVAKSSALSHFEKYRIIQDQLFRSDFDLFLETMGKNGGNDDE